MRIPAAMGIEVDDPGNREHRIKRERFQRGRNRKADRGL
jgi:hypothetical protein